MWQLVLRALDEEPLAGKRVVDFGCGSGEIGLWMANEGAEVYLLDSSREVVDAALERARSCGLERRVRGIVVQGPKLDMFADRGFDLVLTRGVAEPKMMKELARAMKPDARLVVAAQDAPSEKALGTEFGAVKVLRRHDRGSWLGRLLGKKKRGETVITARRAK
jgi:2-polyprenyl-3-methyl-5-hydroxy-6-metoxy-1,4-benzoquinol methylase